MRTYYAEPDRGRRTWRGKTAERDAVYGNRRRVRGKRGKALQRKRGELLERPFAHCYATGGMRRTHLRGHPNILKRLLVHVAGFNLGLLLRQMFGVGTPRGVAERLARLSAAFLRGIWAFGRRLRVFPSPEPAVCACRPPFAPRAALATAA